MPAILRVTSVLFISGAVYSITVAAYLLNQDAQVVPTRTVRYIGSIEGIPTSNNQLMAFAIVMAALLAGIAVLLWRIARKPTIKSIAGG